MTDVTHVAVRADDGVELLLHRAAPDRPREGPAVLLVPGMFSNWTFFLGRGSRGLGHELARHGFDAWVGELRGPTRTREPAGAPAWTFEDWIRRDAPALVKRVRELSGRERVVWVGHSAGAAVGAAFLGTGGEAERVAGLVIAGAPGPRIGPLPWSGAALVFALTKALGRFPARAIGLGPEDESFGILGQWMWWNLARAWRGRDGTDYLAPLAATRQPVLALAGGGDWAIAPPAACRLLLDRLGSDDRTLVTCGRSGGFTVDYDHVGLIASSEAQREVWPVIADWIARRFG